jgi:hypothetical protein
MVMAEEVEQVLTVTSNLESALQHVRARWKMMGNDTCSFRIWVDAICINQADITERGHQVQLMGQIYPSATVVLAWLGNRHESMFNLAFRSVKDIAGEAPTYDSQDSGSCESLRWILRHPALVEKPTGGIRNNAWKDMEIFFDHEYWTRVWIFQEQVLARDTHFFTPSTCLAWSELDAAATKMLQAQDAMLGRDLTRHPVRPEWMPEHVWFMIVYRMVRWTAVERVADMKKKRTAFQSRMLPDSATHLEDPQDTLQKWDIVFRCAKKFRASDSRDLIYGLVGLMNIDIEPDYSPCKTPATVYLQYITGFIQAHIQAGSSSRLRFLESCGVGIHGVDGMRPSWVPDFAKEKLSSSAGGSANFRASGSRLLQKMTVDKVEYLPVVTGSSLRVRGWTVTQVRSISGPISMSRKDNWLLPFIREFLGRNSTYVAGIPSVQALLAIISLREADRPMIHAGMLIELITVTSTSVEMASSTELGASSNLEKDDKVVDMIIAWGASANRQNLDTSNDSSLLQLKQDVREEYNKLRIHLLHMENTWSFCELEDGHLAIVPALTQPGDQLCILDGCGVPVILRQVEDYFIHIGTSYVLGMMTNDDQPVVEARAKASRRFEIR